MARKKLEPYRESGEGLVEIGPFKVQADWDEIGHKEMHFSANLQGGHWVEGLKDNVEWRIRFGRIPPDDLDALKAELAKRDSYSPFEIKLGGKSLNTVYLRELISDADDETLKGLVFSNRFS